MSKLVVVLAGLMLTACATEGGNVAAYSGGGTCSWCGAFDQMEKDAQQRMQEREPKRTVCRPYFDRLICEEQ